MFLTVSFSILLTLVVLAEDPESLLELIFCVGVPDLFVHQVTKFRELHKAGAIHINLNIKLTTVNFYVNSNFLSFYINLESMINSL